MCYQYCGACMPLCVATDIDAFTVELCIQESTTPPWLCRCTSARLAEALPRICKACMTNTGPFTARACDNLQVGPSSVPLECLSCRTLKLPAFEQGLIWIKSQRLSLPRRLARSSFCFQIPASLFGTRLYRRGSLPNCVLFRMPAKELCRACRQTVLVS